MEIKVLDVTPIHPEKDSKGNFVSDVDIVHEIFVRCGNNRFIIKNCNTGQYYFERKVNIFVINGNNEQIHLKCVSVLRLFEKEKISVTAINTGCLITNVTTWKESFTIALEYIKEYCEFFYN